MHTTTSLECGALSYILNKFEKVVRGGGGGGSYYCITTVGVLSAFLTFVAAGAVDAGARCPWGPGLLYS
jgi:hypothetical protein